MRTRDNGTKSNCQQFLVHLRCQMRISIIVNFQKKILADTSMQHGLLRNMSLSYKMIVGTGNGCKPNVKDSHLCAVCAEAGPVKIVTRSHRIGRSCRPDLTGWSSVEMRESKEHHHKPVHLIIHPYPQFGANGDIMCCQENVTIETHDNKNRNMISYHEFALIEAVLSRGEDGATICAAIL